MLSSKIAVIKYLWNISKIKRMHHKLARTPEPRRNESITLVKGEALISPVRLPKIVIIFSPRQRQAKE
jgi:hypothetical protein